MFLWELLPDEIFLQVISYLPLSDNIGLRTVNSRWNVWLKVAFKKLFTAYNPAEACLLFRNDQLRKLVLRGTRSCSIRTLFCKHIKWPLSTLKILENQGKGIVELGMTGSLVELSLNDLNDDLIRENIKTLKLITLNSWEYCRRVCRYCSNCSFKSWSRFCDLRFGMNELSLNVCENYVVCADYVLPEDGGEKKLLWWYRKYGKEFPTERSYHFFLFLSRAPPHLDLEVVIQPCSFQWIFKLQESTSTAVTCTVDNYSSGMVVVLRDLLTSLPNLKHLTLFQHEKAMLPYDEISTMLNKLETFVFYGPLTVGYRNGGDRRNTIKIVGNLETATPVFTRCENPAHGDQHIRPGYMRRERCLLPNDNDNGVFHLCSTSSSSLSSSSLSSSSLSSSSLSSSSLSSFFRSFLR